jgi:6-pyruvoyltetrahydropterin/6-carboxytetrahydropterin synthase
MGTDMFEVSVDHQFSSAHALRNYKGPCENVHGHNWKVQVVIEGEKLDEIGLLVDFVEIKRDMDRIVMRLDHKFLNDLPPFDVKNPSSENLAEHFYQEMAGSLTNLPVRVKEVKVWETPDACATYRP